MKNNFCLRCGKPLKQTPQKREKKYCNSTCRSAKWVKDENAKRKLEKLNQ